MKIISGKYRGRNITGYEIIGTRPTMDRVKESIFAMIQSHINNSITLDLFSGTGNYNLEALSNNAKFAYFNDHNPKCIKIINENIKNLKIENNYQITNLDYKKALEYYKNNNIKFDIIFLDPPYKDKIIENIIDYIINNNLLNENGIIVCETTYKLEINNINLYKERKYGEKLVYIYKK